VRAHHRREDRNMTERSVTLLEDVWGDIASLCGDLTDAQWSTMTECPGWTVRDNVAHMIGTERMLLGEQPNAVASDAAHVKNDIGRANEAWIATYADWDGPKLLDEFVAVTNRRLDVLRAMSAEEWNKEGFTPEGPGPYRQFMEIRVFDCWYHDQDIREALNKPGYLEGDVADLSLNRIPPRGLGYVVGKKAGAPPNTTVTFDIAGQPAMSATISVPPEGRATLLPEAPAEPTVRIATDRRTFARLMGGRWSGDIARAHGTVNVSGDQALGRQIVDNMAFTI
jgi:uncharacterized protein (TIGR03083 family)